MHAVRREQRRTKKTGLGGAEGSAGGQGGAVLLLCMHVRLLAWILLLSHSFILFLLFLQVLFVRPAKVGSVKPRWWLFSFFFVYVCLPVFSFFFLFLFLFL